MESHHDTLQTVSEQNMYWGFANCSWLHLLHTHFSTVHKQHMQQKYCDFSGLSIINECLIDPKWFCGSDGCPVMAGDEASLLLEQTSLLW